MRQARYTSQFGAKADAKTETRSRENAEYRTMRRPTVSESHPKTRLPMRMAAICRGVMRASLSSSPQTAKSVLTDVLAPSNVAFAQYSPSAAQLSLTFQLSFVENFVALTSSVHIHVAGNRVKIGRKILHAAGVSNQLTSMNRRT